MVMHARKTQRMSDGYFEKHQTHPYQNSKYGSSKNYGSSSERYDRIRDSPNGNYRSDSPDSQSPRDRDRSYQSKNSYLQKIREKERENRDYKVSRDKYSDSVRSPKEKRSRDSEHRTNHDRSDDKSILHPIKSQNLSSRDGRKLIHNNCVDKAHQREDRERVARVGDWSEHLSSSGKKYYYNCKTEVSQWEKPREWIERERERDRFRNRDRERDSDRSYGSSSRSGHDKHSNSRPSNSKDGTRESGRHWSSSTRDDDIPSKDVRSSSSRKQSEENAQQSTQDMDISPGDSTPTSETSYRPPECAGDPSSATGPVLLANALPRLVSHPPLGGGGGRPPDVSPILNTPGTPSASVAAPCSTVTTSNAPGPPVSRMSSTEVVDGKLQALSVETNHAGGTGEGPPTPTHSEVADGVKVATVATPSGSPPNSTSGPATSSGLSSLQGVSSSLQALRPQGPSITPSLANHYRDDLVNHVRGWPADILEKQAQKCSEEAHILGSIQCSKVSAELKCARSLVRLTEIQARLQEQRILFLRQQIKTLEELKSQNSFMSDDY